MILYIVEVTHPVKYDSYQRHLVSAYRAEHARVLADESGWGDEKPRREDINCRKIGIACDESPGVLMSEFRAG